MADFKSKDFDNILYPVHTLKKGMDLFSQFDELLNYKEFTEKIPQSTPIERVFKYIVFAYDSKSPYVTQINDLTERKIEAAKDAGFILLKTE